MTRILTGICGAVVVLLALFGLETAWFFWFCAAIFLLATGELIRIVHQRASGAPTWPLFLTVPALAWLLARCLDPAHGDAPSWLPQAGFAAAVLLSVGVGLTVLFCRTPVEESLVAAGTLAFGTFYLAVPLASVAELHRRSPWALVLGLAIVWFGDAAALYVGRAVGRRKMAPVISPNKTWEGAAASLIAALVVTGLWSAYVLGRLDPWLLAAGGLTSIAGQAGDLFESMLKRGAGVKDSGNLLPGHGGILDRIDALLFGAPVLAVGFFLLP